MKVRIDRDRESWHYSNESVKRGGFTSYPQTVRAVAVDGHEVDNAGWRQKLLSWNFNMHAIDGYPEWEIERDRSPAFIKLTHVRGKGDVESSTLCNAWDDIAEAGFYQRDWTDDGIPFVNEGDTYWSGWWFATIAERDRFVKWLAEQSVAKPSVIERIQHAITAMREGLGK